MKETAKKIVIKKIDEVIPYEKNPRKNEKVVDFVANSIREFGFKNPIIIDEHNVIICGHTRLKAAQKLGLKEVPTVVATDLTDDQIKAYRLADNKVSEISTWDKELLAEELAGLEDMEAFGFEELTEDALDDEKYVSIGKSVEYQITGECPDIQELVDESKKQELLERIDNAKIPAETKAFLRKAATRHDVFNYAKIAEFYAHQTAEIQQLMEESALVIIDFNDAIKKWFCRANNGTEKA